MNVTSDEVPAVRGRSPPGALLNSDTRLDARHLETDLELGVAAEAKQELTSCVVYEFLRLP